MFFFFYCIVGFITIQLSTALESLCLSPGQLRYNDSEGKMNPKLWVALSGGKVVVFDAASWSILQGDIQLSSSQLVSADMLYYNNGSNVCIKGNSNK